MGHIQNSLHCQKLDDSAGALDFGELSRVVERGAFMFSVFVAAEADEEAALATEGRRADGNRTGAVGGFDRLTEGGGFAAELHEIPCFPME